MMDDIIFNGIIAEILLKRSWKQNNIISSYSNFEKAVAFLLILVYI